MDNTWIKLHRKFIEWEWFDKPEMVQIFIFLLISANYRRNEWRGIQIKRGQFVTSVAKIQEKTGLSRQTIRTCLDKLKSTNEITIETTNRYTMVTITGYDDYQETEDPDQPTKQPTKQQTTNKQLTTNKKEKKEKKEIDSEKGERKTSNLRGEFATIIEKWFDYKKERGEEIKSDIAKTAFIETLINYSGNDEAKAEQIINQAFTGNYPNIAKLKKRKTSEKKQNTNNVNELWTQ